MFIRSRRLVSASSALSLVLSAMSLVAVATLSAVAGSAALASPASAAAPTSGPVSADALPTVQINGVVWRQAIAGNIAFAGGEFTNARPAGAAPGVNTVPRTNLLAYDIRTGVLISSFNPVLNGKVNDLTVTPDGTKLVVGGQFTTIDGQNRYRVAIFNLTNTDLSQPPTFALSSFAPAVDGSVYGVAATNSSVFVGGQFSVAAKQARSRFASFAISNGALLPAVINVADQSVKSIVVSPDGSQVVISGGFTSVNGSSNPGYGIYRANALTGAGLPLPLNNEVRDGGTNSAILHLASDGTYFYGGGYKYVAGASGNTEGTFQAKWSDGSLVTLEDCHGDTYDIAPVGDLVYKASHKHYCGNSGGFPQTDPWTRWDSTAWTKTVEGSPNIRDAYGYPDHPGLPHPGLAAFFPQTDVGTYTGKTQAVWTVTGNSQYVLYGGEFPRVNGTAQEGLVRFAVRSIAPNKQAPRTTDTPTFDATARSLEPGKVRVTWPTLWDRDDATLTYDLYRDGTKIKSFTATAYQWDGYQMSYDDTGLLPGSAPAYQVRVTDPSGNKNNSSTATATVALTDSVGTYGSQVLADGASKYWRLNEGGNSVTDTGGSDNTTAGTGVGRNAAGALLNSLNTASNFDGTSNGRVIGSQLTTTTSNMSEELWFKTNGSTSGKLAGFGNLPSGNSSLFDRHIYMNGGKISFGVTTTANTVITSPGSYADGKWHQVVATLGSNGMGLYMDGALVASNQAVTYGRPYPGYFRIGGDNSWAGNQNFKGAIDEVSVYPTALTPQQVDNHWVASGRTSTNPPGNSKPTASFTATPTGLDVSVDGSASTDTDGTVSSYSWNWGDNTPAGSGATASHHYANSGTYQVTLTVTDNGGATGTLTKSVTVAAPNQAPTAAFTTTQTNLQVGVDGSTSSDSDGTIANYSWKWGDLKPDDSGTSATASHTYDAAGTYTITLTVTDDQGATGVITHDVTVASATVLASDDFNRTLASGWGTATKGGSWSLGSAATQYSVSPGSGKITIPTSGRPTADLKSINATNTDTTVEFSVDKLVATTYVGINGRWVGTNTYNSRIKIAADGTVLLYVLRDSTGIGAAYAVPGMVIAPNTKYKLRLQVKGTSPTTLSAKVWASSGTEPDWQISRPDTLAPVPALQGPGYVGLYNYIPSGGPLNTTFYSYLVTDGN